MKKFAWIALVALGCGGGGDDPMMDDPRWENARLEIVGSSAVNLQWTDTAELVVRYLDQDDAPIEEAPIDWAIEGDEAGSRISALQSYTDLNGTARITVTAGMMNTMFGVVASPPAGGDPVRFDVAVSDTAIGSITVTMLYSGERELSSFEAQLFDGEACSGLDPTDLPDSLRSVPASMLSERPGFAGVEPGTMYTVAVLARNARNQLSAFGCTDLIVVAAGNDTEVDVSLNEQALPPDFVGVWDLENQFDFGGALPPSVDDLINVIGELADDNYTDIDGNPSAEEMGDGDLDGDGITPEYGVDPGAFVMDIAMRQTCDWECASGEEYGECSIGHRMGDVGALYERTFNTWGGCDSRFFSGCAAWEVLDTTFQNQINARAPAAFTSTWLQLAADLSNAITNAQITSRLTISPSAGNEFEVPIEHELLEMRVPYRTIGGGSMVATFTLTDAGFMSIPAEETSMVDGEMLIIPDHSFDMNWGELALYIYREVLLPGVFGVTSTGELIAEWVDCNQIAVWVDDEAGFLSPGVSDLEGYCMDGLNAVGSLLEDELAGRIDAPGTLTIRGTALGDDIDPATGRVDALVDGMWEGTFTEEDMMRELSGTFTGFRAP